MIKIALVDDHTLLRDALSGMIAAKEGMLLSFSVANGKEMISSIEAGDIPDLVVLDLNMPVMDGYESAEWLRKNYPAVLVLIVTMYDSEVTLIRLLQLGVRGFIKKDCHPQELIQAIKQVAETGYYYSSKTTFAITHLIARNGDQNPLSRIMLSDVEIQFLKLASTDMTYKEIAHVMKMNPRTIDNYREALFTKLDVKSRVGLAIYAVKNGIVRI